MLKVSEIYGMLVAIQKSLLINKETLKNLKCSTPFFLLHFKLLSPYAELPKISKISPQQ